MTDLSLVDIELAVVNYFNMRRHVIVPNVSYGLGLHECDLLVAQPNGYAIEVEIKRSRFDLLADAKKPHSHESDKIRKLYFAMPVSMYEKCKDDVPKRAGIIVVDRSKSGAPRASRMREPEVNAKARKLTDAELFKLTKLGVMRIWALKRKVQALSDKLKAVAARD